MAIETPPGIDPAPTPAPQRGDRATFSNRVDAFVTWLTLAVSQFAAVALNVKNNALEAMGFATAAQTSATNAASAAATAAADAVADVQTELDASVAAAAGSATAAGTSATNAANSASAAAGSASAAAGSATAASTSATNAASSASALVATSTSSNTIGLGNKTFTVGAGKQFLPNVPAIAVDAADPANFVTGPIVSYSGTTLVIGATSFGGSGTIANWNISLSGPRGAAGAAGSLTGGNLTAALNYIKGADVASASTPDIWSAPSNGNYMTMTGTADITGYTAAPQAGAHRRYIAGGAFKLVNGPNHILNSAQDYITTAGDQIDVWAETTTKSRVTVTKADGTAMSISGNFQNAIRVSASGTFIARRTGWHRITLTGGRARPAFAVGTNARATGNGAPGLCIGMRYLIKGQSYTVLLGADGASATYTSVAGMYPGAAGSATTFSGSGIATMTANGGNPGGTYVGASPATMAGGVGGTATGGDLNFTGGDGGAITGTALGTLATGGGAVALQGTSYRGGNITASVGNASTLTATGGAGVGGNGGDATSGSGQSTYSGSGGAGGDAATIAAGNGTGVGGVDAAGGAPGSSAITQPPLLNTFASATGSGLTAGTTSAPVAGGGAPGGASNSNQLPASTALGGGGVYVSSSLAVSVTQTMTTGSTLQQPGAVAATANGAANAIIFNAGTGTCWIEF